MAAFGDACTRAFRLEVVMAANEHCGKAKRIYAICTLRGRPL